MTDRYLVLPDQYIHRFNFHMRPVLKTVSGTPAVLPVSIFGQWPTTIYCKFPERWQFYHCDLLALSKYGKTFSKLSKVQKFFVIRAFKGTTGSINAFNNGKGTDYYACYPSRQNLNKPDPSWESLICAGNYVYSDSEPIKDFKGRWMVKVLSFLEGDTPPAPSLDDPRVQIATIIRRDGSLRGFPHLKGSKTYFPFLTKQPCVYPLEDLQKV